MKLKEFLEIALIGEQNESTLGFEENVIYGENLNKYKHLINECDEFSKCESLDIITTPLVKGKNGEVYTTQTIKLSDLMEFKGKCYLLSLALTPEMAQDVSGANYDLTLRNDIHKLLDDVLNNPDEYKTKGFRGILVRGLFEVIDNNDGSETLPKRYDIDLKQNTLDAKKSSDRLTNILKKNKEVEDKIAEVEKYHEGVKKFMKLKKESEK